jgi:phosphohistidine phosphatase
MIHERPLNKRGKNDAPRMVKLLQKEKLIPDAIISSTAMRDSATAESLVKACGYKGEVTLKRSLYAAGPETYLQLLRGVPNGSMRVLVVGHNPGVEELLELLTSEIRLLPTCSVAHLNLQIGSWSDLDFETTKGQLVDIWLSGDIT